MARSIESITLLTSQLLSGWLNEVAYLNIQDMVVTDPTPWGWIIWIIQYAHHVNTRRLPFL